MVLYKKNWIERLKNLSPNQPHVFTSVQALTSSTTSRQIQPWSPPENWFVFLLIFYSYLIYFLFFYLSTELGTECLPKRRENKHDILILLTLEEQVAPHHMTDTLLYFPWETKINCTLCPNKQKQQHHLNLFSLCYPHANLYGSSSMYLPMMWSRAHSIYLRKYFHELR